MARKWCGMPLRISSWQQGCVGEKQEARLDSVPAQLPPWATQPGLRDQACLWPRAWPSHCTTPSIHAAECAAPACCGTGWVGSSRVAGMPAPPYTPSFPLLPLPHGSCWALGRPCPPAQPCCPATLSSFSFLRRHSSHSLAIRPHRIHVSSSKWLRLEEAEELDTSEEPLFRREPFMERMDLESASRSLGREGQWRWAGLKALLALAPPAQGPRGHQGLGLSCSSCMALAE